MDYGDLCAASMEVPSLKITWKIPEYLSLPNTPLYSSPYTFANTIWCLQLHPEKLQAMSVSLVRLRSLIWRQKITCMFNVLKRNGEYLKDEQEYRPLKFYDGVHDEYDGTYNIGEIPKSSSLVAGQDILTSEGTLVLVGHLLFEELIEEELHKNDIGSSDRGTDIHKEGEMEKNSSILSLTFSKIHSLKITWKVPKYQSLLENGLGYSLNSPSFDFGCATWFFRLYPVGAEENESGTGLSIIRSRSVVQLLHKIIWTQDVLTEDDKPFNYNFYLNYKYKNLSFNGDSEMKESGKVFFDTRTILVDCLAMDDDGNVTFFFHIFYEDAPVKQSAVQKMLSELHMYRTFGEVMKNFLLNGSGHDLILKVKEKEFRVHRQILSARSPVFESMLSHDMTEKNFGVVSIPDCDPAVIEQFLLYLYCGKMDSLDETNVLGLYYVADKYEVVHLKEICRGFIRNTLSPRNVCDIIQLAMNHSDEDLVAFATEYFVKNKDEVLNTAEWVSFMNENEDVANKILNKTSEKGARQKEKTKNEQKAKRQRME